jgi:hypothetical protein
MGDVARAKILKHACEGKEKREEEVVSFNSCVCSCVFVCGDTGKLWKGKKDHEKNKKNKQTTHHHSFTKKFEVLILPLRVGLR